MNSDESGYMTTRETGDYLRSSVETLRYWRVHGVGPAYYRTGRKVLYRRADLDRWLQEQRVDA